MSLLLTGEIAKARAHYRSEPRALRSCGTSTSLRCVLAKTSACAALAYRSLALWLLGYPEAALADAESRPKGCARDRASCDAYVCPELHSSRPKSTAGITRQQTRSSSELIALADQKGARTGSRSVYRCRVVCWSGLAKASAAVQRLTSGMAALRSTGATLLCRGILSNLARAYADLGEFDDAWRCIDEAMTVMQTTKESWCEAEVNRIAGEIALKSPEPDAAKAEAYFERALAVARQQQAKSWELRAAMSLARLWRDQGKVQQARELLAPVYGWFTEGFDTRDLKEAKALLEELAA